MENIVLIIIITTGVISFLSWRNPDLFEKLLLSPYKVIKQKEYYRLITHGFVHVDWMHLIINMFVFWSFGSALIFYFLRVWKAYGVLLFLLLYLSSMVVSSLYSLIKHRNNYHYSAVGASGATSAIVFACVFFNPWNEVLFFGVLPIPGIVFAIAYLVYEYIMGRKANDNIGHDAHFWGALYGFIFPLIFKPQLFYFFIENLKNIHF